MSDHHETFLTRLQQAKRWGVSKRSVERWGEDEKLGLPPELEINSRRYRKLSDIEAWERSRVVASIPNSAERKRTRETEEADTPASTCSDPAAGARRLVLEASHRLAAISRPRTALEGRRSGDSIGQRSPWNAWNT